jgi:phosphoglycolate phosphatase
MSRPEVVLCDLDGTITDSFPGIDRCLRLALPSIGLDRLTDADIRAFLGPPLHYTLKEVYGKSDEDVARFVRVYRAEYFGGGEYEFTVFPGMADLLVDIAASDMALVLATAKPIESAERVLVKAGLIDLFDAVSGSELDLLRQGKPEVIAHGITLIGRDPGSVRATMIGDRKEDISAPPLTASTASACCGGMPTTASRRGGPTHVGGPTRSGRSSACDVGSRKRAADETTPTGTRSGS